MTADNNNAISLSNPLILVTLQLVPDKLIPQLCQYILYSLIPTLIDICTLLADSHLKLVIAIQIVSLTTIHCVLFNVLELFYFVYDLYNAYALCITQLPYSDTLNSVE